jgi:hypothetical protein
VNNAIYFPTAEEEKTALDDFFRGMGASKKEHRAAAITALEALPRLIAIMPQRTGQSYKVRSLLYSLWNGQATSLSDVMNLDWSIRKDVCAVVLGFGFEDETTHLWYDEISDALKAAGQFQWFLEAHGESEGREK